MSILRKALGILGRFQREAVGVCPGVVMAFSADDCRAGGGEWTGDSQGLLVRRAPGGNGMESGVKLCLAASLLDRLCIGLYLLREGLDSLALVGAVDGRQALRLQRAAQDTPIALRNGKFVLALDEIEHNRWLFFILRTVRDGGIAEADHLDVAAAADGHFTVADDGRRDVSSPGAASTRRGAATARSVVVQGAAPFSHSVPDGGAAACAAAFHHAEGGPCGRREFRAWFDGGRRT